MYCIICIQVTEFESHPHPCHVPPPTRSIIWCLISFQVACHLHPGHENCTSAPSWSYSNLSMYQNMQLNSIQVPSHPHPFPEIDVSPQSTLIDSCLLPIQIVSHLNPGPYICLWTTTRWCFTSIPVLPSCISDPPRHHLKLIQVSICASNFHPGPAQRNSGHKILVSPSSMNCLQQGP